MNRRTPYSLTSKLTVKNRIVVPPMASQTADRNGYVTEKTLAHYERLLDSGAGLVFVEYSYVHRLGRSESNQLGVDTDWHIPGLRRLANLIRSRGAVPALQMTFAGGKSHSTMTGGPLIGPSVGKVPTLRGKLEDMQEASEKQIQGLIKSFVKGASRAVAAGFELIEIHSAHGYGINQWLSPITNTRSDRWGGDLAGRSRILRDIVQAIRLAHPQLGLSLRFPGQDGHPEGLSVYDMIDIAKGLPEVDILNVSSGIGGWDRPPSLRRQGYLVDEAQILRRELDKTIIGVGGIKNGDWIDASLAARKFDLAAVGRAILRDPLAWNQQELA